MQPGAPSKQQKRLVSTPQTHTPPAATPLSAAPKNPPEPAPETPLQQPLGQLSHTRRRTIRTTVSLLRRDSSLSALFTPQSLQLLAARPRPGVCCSVGGSRPANPRCSVRRIASLLQGVQVALSFKLQGSSASEQPGSETLEHSRKEPGAVHSVRINPPSATSRRLLSPPGSQILGFFSSLLPSAVVRRAEN